MIRIAAGLLLLVLATDARGGDMEISPFRTVNQSPLVQIFGLPVDASPVVTPPARLTLQLQQDISSNYTQHSTAREQIRLDGETYRWTLAARYGFGSRWEAGVEIPYLVQGGGFLYGFILDWHRAFGLPQGGRDEAPRGQIAYSYSKDGVQRLNMSRSGAGIGDISLTGGMTLYRSHEGQSRDDLALRIALKLPSGDSSALRGSGSTDLALQFCGSMQNQTEWGTLGVFGALGGMVMTDGRVLAGQQRNLAGLGNAGIGWGPAEWISFKVQLNGHTALYQGSSLPELSDSSLMLVAGGALKLPGDYLLDIGVSEDVAVATAPDVSFHLGLSRRF